MPEGFQDKGIFILYGALPRVLSTELRLVKIDTDEGPTRYLNDTFIPKHGKLFGVVPEDPSPAWRALPGTDLRNILCRQYEAKVNCDNTASAEGQVLQLSPTKTRLSFAKASVVVNHWIDGSWHVFHRAVGEIPCTPIPGRIRPMSYLHPKRESKASASL